MDIRIQTDCYHLFLNPFHIEEGHVLVAVEQPDSRRTIDLGGSEHVLLFRAFGVSPQISGLLVHGLKESEPDDALVVIAAYWLPLTSSRENDPLVLLQQLMRRFGFPIVVRGIRTHFIGKQSVPISPNDELTDIIGYETPEGADFVSLPLVRRTVEPGGSQSLEIALTYALNTAGYLDWLNQTFETQTVRHFVHPSLTNVSLADLISPEGTLSVVTRLPWDHCEPQTLVAIDGFGYSFALGFVDGCAVIERNGEKASVEYQHLLHIQDSHVVCFFIWSRESLSVRLMNVGEAETATMPTIPPNRLHAWLDARALWPRRYYSSEEEVFTEVLLLVQRMEEQVRSLNFQSQFWRDWRTGEPKDETELQPLIHALLADRARLKQLEVVPERVVGGSGRLDFSLSGILAAGGRATICLECKLAQSGKLVQGISSALPEYMRSLQTDHGIYCVVYFGPDSGLPRRLRDPDMLLEQLQNAVLIRGVRGIRPVLLDVSRPISPSKKRD